MSFAYNCNDFHSNCLFLWKYKLFNTIKSSAKLYFVFYFLSNICFKLNKIIMRFKCFNNNNEKFVYITTIIKKLLDNILRSMFYMTFYIMTLRISNCLISKYLKYYNIYLAILQFVTGLLGCLVENSSRVYNVATFSFVKSLPGLYEVIINYYNIKKLKISNFIYILFSMSLCFSNYLNEYYLNNSNDLYYKKNIKIKNNILTLLNTLVN